MIHAVSIDQALMVVALCAYILSTLLLLTYFFSRFDLYRDLAIPLVIAGCIAQFAQLFARYQITGVWPLLNLYGSLSLFSAMSVGLFIIFAFRYKLWFAGGFVVAIAAIFLAYGLTWNEGTLPAVPSLQSYWAKIHVPLVVSSYSAFMIAFVMSGLYLLKYYFDRHLRARTVATQVAAASPRRDTPNIEAAAAQGDIVAGWLTTMPSLAQLDVMIYRIIAVGLPLLTLGIITGAWWAKEAWGAYWQWDPKETAALLSWIVYAIYMHLHTRSAWRGMRATWVSLVGFVTIIFCYLGVNIWISGLHSYKM